jgi:hypothetical protein
VEEGYTKVWGGEVGIPGEVLFETNIAAIGEVLSGYAFFGAGENQGIDQPRGAEQHSQLSGQLGQRPLAR